MKRAFQFAMIATFSMIGLSFVSCASEDTQPGGVEDVSDEPDGKDDATAVTVTMGPMSFINGNVTVKKGTKVIFKNTSPVLHTLTSGASSNPSDNPGAAFDKVMPPKKTVKLKFTKVGDQPYFCRPHEEMGMVGTVTVTP
jgi:plastocyanin